MNKKRNFNILQMQKRAYLSKCQNQHVSLSTVFVSLFTLHNFKTLSSPEKNGGSFTNEHTVASDQRLPRKMQISQRSLSRAV